MKYHKDNNTYSLPTLDPHCTYIDNTGASWHFLVPIAPVTNINYNAPAKTVGTASSKLVQSTAMATLNLPNLSRGTMGRHIMPTFINSLISMGKFCNAECAVTFTKTD